MLLRFRVGTISLMVAAGCYSAVTDPGAGLPADIASIRLVNQSGVDRTRHLPLFPDLPETLTVRPYRADGTAITEIAGGVSCAFLFSPSDLASVDAEPDSLTKVVRATVRAGAGGAFYVTLRFAHDTATKTFGPFDVVIH